MKLSGIYCIRHLLSGKVYIGSSVDIKQRWRQHSCYLNLLKHPNMYLQAAWNKYGEKAFVFEVLELVSETYNLTTVEQSYLDHIDTEMTYNLAPVAGSQRGCKLSAETRARMSAAKKLPRKPLSEAHKAAIRATNTGRKASPETLAKMSAIHKGRKFSEEHKKKMSEAAFARWARRGSR